MSWMCKKQSSVSHSSTESEIISLDAGLRLDGIPALDLWDLTVSVLGNRTQNDRTVKPVVCRFKKHVNQQSHGMFNVLNNIDLVSSNVHSSRQEALLYVFEDKEAVIKMIVNGRSPTMRHVSSPHRVALDWLLDRLFLSVYVDDIKLTGRKQNLDPMWKVLNKEVDLGEPTSFLDHVYLGCTQRQCQISKDIVDNYRTMFKSRISEGRVEKLPFPQNLRISSWSYDMEGHAKKCVERYCDLANKTTQQLYKVSTPCIDDHHFKEETKSVGELSQVCSQIFLKCLYLARIGRPDILW